MSFFGIPMRNGLPLGLGTVASLTNGPGFLPSELFYNGTVQGAWYDPSDLTTLFQDSAGTTPVTAVEQPVGLMLDKSKGLVLGSELVTNGDFSNGTTGWSVSGVNNTLSVDAGRGKCVSSVTDGAFFGQGISVVAGTWYRVTYTAFSDGTSKAPAAYIGNAVGNGVRQDAFAFGTKTFYFLATTTGTEFLWFYPGTAQGAPNYILIDDVTVRTVAGNHAFQTTSASRPTLRARYNLLTRSEEFNDAAWTTFAGSATVSANAAVAPDGTTTADKLIASTTSGNQLIRQAPTSAAGTYVFSCYMKNDGYNQGALIVWDNIAAQFATILFNLTNGTITTGTIGNGGNQGIANLSGAVVSLPNGWFRCAVTFTTTSTTINVYPGVYNATTFGGNGLPTAWAGNGTSGILVWGAQLVPTAVFPSNTYQRVGAATDYATGAAFPPYLFFDGTDDSMLTNSVDFTGTDKMLVVAGVTKQAQAVNQRIVEFSADTSTNPGTFQMWPGDWATGTGSRYSFSSRGTAALAQAQTAESPANYAAPISNVLTATGDINGDSSILRINGAQVATGTGDQGTGNFGNYPLFIGSRGGTSLRFNGNIYSLIIAGQSYSSGQISSTESWVAAKTPLGTI